LQIGTDVLLIITSTSDKHLNNVNIDDLDDLEQFSAVAHIIRVNCPKIAADLDKLHMKFFA